MHQTKISRFPIMPEPRKRMISNTLLGWAQSPKTSMEGAHGRMPTLADIAKRCSGVEGRHFSPEQALEAHLDPASGHSDFIDILADFGRNLAHHAYLNHRPHAAFVNQTEAPGAPEHFKHQVARKRDVSFRDLIVSDLYAVGHKFTLLGTEIASSETATVFSLLQTNPDWEDGQPIFSRMRGNDLLGHDAPEQDLVSCRDALVGFSHEQIMDDILGGLASAKGYVQLRDRRENQIVAVKPRGCSCVQLPTNTLEVANPFRDVSSWYMMRDPQIQPGLDLSFAQGQMLPRIEIKPSESGIEALGALQFDTRVANPGSMIRMRIAA